MTPYDSGKIENAPPLTQEERTHYIEVNHWFYGKPREYYEKRTDAELIADYNRRSAGE